MAGGFTPSVHLFSQSRGKLAWDADLQAYLPGQSAEAERSAGACRGRFALDEALSDGIDAGRAAARAAGFSRSEEHTSELQSLMRISYAVFCLKKKKRHN